MPSDWCATCSGAGNQQAKRGTTRASSQAAESKQELLDRLTSAAGVPRGRVGVGSSLPSTTFRHIAERFGITHHSMPATGEALCKKAGIPWTTECDSRAEDSLGGSTVTAGGLQAMINAVDVLAGKQT